MNSLTEQILYVQIGSFSFFFVQYICLHLITFVEFITKQMAKKPGTISTDKDLGQHVNDRLLVLTAGFDEVILVFDTYKADSLKQKPREKRRQGKGPIQYQIADDTNIKHLPMERFLSHEKMKADLTEYFAQAVLKNNANSQKLVITLT